MAFVPQTEIVGHEAYNLTMQTLQTAGFYQPIRPTGFTDRHIIDPREELPTFPINRLLAPEYPDPLPRAQI